MGRITTGAPEARARSMTMNSIKGKLLTHAFCAAPSAFVCGFCLVRTITHFDILYLTVMVLFGVSLIFDLFWTRREVRRLAASETAKKHATQFLWSCIFFSMVSLPDRAVLDSTEEKTLICEMQGVKELGEGFPVGLYRDAVSGRLFIRAFNECGNNYTDVDFATLVDWLRFGLGAAVLVAEEAGPSTGNDAPRN